MKMDREKIKREVLKKYSKITNPCGTILIDLTLNEIEGRK